MNEMTMGASHRVLTVPNILTAARIAMAAAAAALFGGGRWNEQAFALCLAAVVTDGVDGWYARRKGECSELGRYLDPLADKLVTLVIYSVIAARMGSTAIWGIVAMITARDIAVTAMRSRSMTARGSCLGADWYGKVKMFLQSALGLFILFYGYFVRANFDFAAAPVVVAMTLILVLSYAAAIRFVFARRRIGGVWGRAVAASRWRTVKLSDH